MDEEIENGGADGDGEYGSDDFEGIDSDVCEGRNNDVGESDGDDGEGGSDDEGSDGSDGDGDGDDDSEGPGDVPARIARGRSSPRRMLNALLTRGGCCKDSCLLKYRDLTKRRALTLSRLDKKTRKAVVNGMLSVIRNKCGS